LVLVVEVELIMVVVVAVEPLLVEQEMLVVLYQLQ
jgi:hypothetical protein